MSDLDFPGLAQRLLPLAESLLSEWFPAGRRQGNEYILGNVQGDPGASLSINVTTGLWSDFSAGLSGGDLTSLYAAKVGISNAQAYRVLSGVFPNGNGRPHRTNGRPPANGTRTKAIRQVLSPVPADAPPCTCYDSKLGLPSKVFAYRTAAGQLSGYIARYEPRTDSERETLYNGRNKQVKPWTYGIAPGKQPKWERAGWSVPRPLYGLDDLATRSQAPVMVVEGEPAADAARTFARDYVVVTWQAGVAGVEYADFTPLHGRSLLLWPDADEPGMSAMWKVARILEPHCPQVKLISPTDRPEGWDAADFIAESTPESKVDFARFKTWAVPRLRTITEKELRERFKVASAPGASAPGTSAPGTAAPAAPDPVPPAAPPPQTPAAPKATLTGPATGASRKVNWYLWQLDCNGQGEPLSNLNNAVTVLERDAQLNGLVWYDEFLNRILTTTADGKPREWTDADDINLALDVQRRIGVSKIAIDTVSKAIVAVAMRNVRNCVRDWIDSLKWDGVPRIDHFFEDHFGAERTAYTTAASKNFWLSMLARVYRPGCKVDNVIVLEGAEGLGKSTVLQIVAGEWFTEQHESLMNPKAFFEVIQGALITEIGEMDSFSRAELTKVMAVVTCRSDKYREAYGRYSIHHPRQGIFVCTTNERASNRSPDGGRRWWYIFCTQVDTASVAANREQYFAEARARLAPDSGWNDALWRFNSGEPWWIMPGDETKAEQSSRYEPDLWASVVSEYLKGRTSATIPEILEMGLSIKPHDMSKSQEIRVGNVLRFLKWERSLERVEGRPMRIWRPPG